MIPAATENECRIWYTCVIYLKVTRVCGKTYTTHSASQYALHLASVFIVVNSS